jgi:zinc protease
VILQDHPAAEVAAVQLWIRTGARHESDGESGFAHFIEHLLFKGTPTRGPGEIDRTISSTGGEMNAATSQDFTCFHVVLPDRHLETGLAVLGDAAQHAAFDPGELERERHVVLEEIRRAEDTPSASLWRLLARHHFAGHAYARPVLGTPETIGSATREGIVAFYRRYYAPSNATLVVIGANVEDRALALVERAFGDWASRSVPAASQPRVAALAGRHRIRQPRDLRQSYLCVAWRGPLGEEADAYPTDLLVSILGSGRTSRLYQSLREGRDLVSSITASFYPQHDAGTVLVSARTTPEKAAAVEAAVLAETERLRLDLCEDDELRRARTAVEADHAFGRETAEGTAHAYGLADSVWTLDHELAYLERIRGVTREEVREAARRHLTSGRLTVAVLGPPPARDVDDGASEAGGAR